MQKKTLIVISDIPDALYDSDKDQLFFKKLETVSSIFKGIDMLYREATNDEVDIFLKNDFIKLDSVFEVENIGIQNRRRIALAIKIMSELDDNQKRVFFHI